MQNILVIAAHPDDEVLGCGATIVRYIATGDKVWVLILGEGITSRSNLSVSEKHQSLRVLQDSAKAAAHILGIEEVIFNRFPDNRFDSVALLEIVHKIETVVRKVKPQVVYTHHHADVNIDHQRTAQAVEAVVRPMFDTSIMRVLSFEVPSSTEWNFVRKDVFQPNVFISIENAWLEKKVKAMEAYMSEMRTFPHPRSSEYLRALATVRGGQSGYCLAEAFELVYWRQS